MDRAVRINSASGRPPCASASGAETGRGDVVAAIRRERPPLAGKYDGAMSHRPANEPAGAGEERRFVARADRDPERRPDSDPGLEAGSALREADVRLVRDALAGEATAVEVLADRLVCVPRILSALDRRSGGRLGEHDLADLSQDTLIVLWNKLETYEGRGRIETWAYRFCFLEFMNRVRSHGRRTAVERTSTDGLAEPPAPTPDLLAFEEHECLERGLEELGSPEADVIRMKHYDERTFEDIGKELRLSPSTVKSRYYRGIEWLRRRLEPVLRKEER